MAWRAPIKHDRKTKFPRGKARKASISQSKIVPTVANDLRRKNGGMPERCDSKPRRQRAVQLSNCIEPKTLLVSQMVLFFLLPRMACGSEGCGRYAIPPPGTIKINRLVGISGKLSLRRAPRCALGRQKSEILGHGQRSDPCRATSDRYRARTRMSSKRARRFTGPS